MGHAVRPLTDTSDFIIWEPRRYNNMADHAANVALDLGSDWERCEHSALQEARACKANLRLCVDGARRGNSSAAGGMALMAYYQGGRREVIFRSGKLLGELSSAFASEMLALDWALQTFLVLMDM